MQNAFSRLKKLPASSFFALSLLTLPLPLYGDSSSEVFSQMIEKKRWSEAENWIQQLPITEQNSLARYSLQLAHAYGSAGLHEKALHFLTMQWKQIEDSNLCAYGFMLKARLMMNTQPQLAWEHFERARQKLSLDEWPASDASSYYQLQKERELGFHQELQTLEKLVDGGLHLEALASVDKILLMLQSGASPDFNLHSSSGKSLERHLLLTKAQLLQELQKPEQALDLLDQWPSENDSSMRLIFINQDLNRNYIRGLCLLDLGQSEQALAELQASFESSRQHAAPAIVRLRCALALSQALHATHQTSKALSLLDAAQDFVYECHGYEQNKAHFAWSKQSVSLLIETGQLHKAQDLLEFQLKLRHDPRSKSGLLLLKAKLLETMNDPQVFAVYIELFSYPLAPQEQQEIIQKILKIVDTPTPNEEVAKWQSAFCQVLLSSKRVEFSDKSRLEVSDWLLRQGLASTEALRNTVTFWLKDLEKGPWKAPALYLLGQLEPQQTQKSLYFQRVFQSPNVSSSLKALAAAWLEQLSSKPVELRVENMMRLAKGCEGKSQDMILTQAFDLALQHDIAVDPLPWIKKIAAGSNLDIIFQEWKLSQHPSGKERECCLQALKAASQRADLWGLRASYTLSRTLLETQPLDQALEPLITWSNLAHLQDQFKRTALMQIADIYYQQNQMQAARKYILQILDQYGDFEERPWLQLRQYSEPEYLTGLPESIKCLQEIQQKYPYHPAALTASCLESRSCQHLHGYSLQSLKAWEGTLTLAQKLQQKAFLTAQAQEIFVIALIEKSRCLSHLGMQRQAINSLKSAFHPSVETTIPALESELEKQVRLEIASLHQKLGEIELAQKELQFICADLFPSKWQAIAAFELAQIKLDQGEGEACLHLLESITCYQEEQVQKRLLIAARACQSLGQTKERQSYLAQLMKRPQATPVQEEALWYVYVWNKDAPLIAERALQKLSLTNHPLAKQAKEELAKDMGTQNRDKRKASHE